MMRALVTGGAGFIGSHVVERLVADGWEVAVVDDLSSGRREQVGAGARLHVADITSDGAVDLIVREKPEVVFHLAAQIDVRRSIADPAFDGRVNVVGSLNVLEGARRAGARLVVFASTGGAVYGDGVPVPTPEDAPTEPVSIYGASKLAVERYLHVYHAVHGLSYAALRFANVYGPRQDPHGEAGVVAIFCDRLQSGAPCVVYGDGRQTRDYVFVEDVARACALASTLTGAHALNIGTGIETDVLALHAALRTVADRGSPPEHAPARPGEQRRSAVDPGRAAALLGWRPRHTLHEGLERTWRWASARD